MADKKLIDLPTAIKPYFSEKSILLLLNHPCFINDNRILGTLGAFEIRITSLLLSTVFFSLVSPKIFLLFLVIESHKKGGAYKEEYNR